MKLKFYKVLLVFVCFLSMGCNDSTDLSSMHVQFAFRPLKNSGVSLSSTQNASGDPTAAAAASPTPTETQNIGCEQVTLKMGKGSQAPRLTPDYFSQFTTPTALNELKSTKSIHIVDAIYLMTLFYDCTIRIQIDADEESLNQTVDADGNAVLVYNNNTIGDVLPSGLERARYVTWTNKVDSDQDVAKLVSKHWSPDLNYLNVKFDTNNGVETRVKGDISYTTNGAKKLDVVWMANQYDKTAVPPNATSIDSWYLRTKYEEVLSSGTEKNSLSTQNLFTALC